MIHSLSTKKKDNKIFVCRFSKKIKSKLNFIENSKTRGGNSVDLDEVAHYEPPHQDLQCLQISYFRLWSLVLKKTISFCFNKCSLPLFHMLCGCTSCFPSVVERGTTLVPVCFSGEHSCHIEINPSLV